MEIHERPLIVSFSLFFPDSGQISLRSTLKHGSIQAEVSTTRSDEDPCGPGSTLSFPIVLIHLSWPDYLRLAMITRSDGLSAGLAATAPSEYGA